MTQDQIAIFAIVAGMMALFVWGRLRYDVVAGLALAAAIVAGVVPADRAFTGFADDIVIIVASALVVSAAVSRTGLVEYVVGLVGPHLKTTTLQVVALAGTVTVLSGFVKNIGALALLLPVAFQLARRHDTSPSALLMPMAFGSLLGGLVTLIGTSPNIIVSRMRAEILGEPFRMFDFAPVAIGISVAGLAFLAIGWRLLPRDRRGAASIDAAFNIEDYTTEARVEADSAVVGETVAAFEALADDEVEVTAIVRRYRSQVPSPATVLKAGDILILEGEPAALEQAVAKAKLRLAREDREIGKDDHSDEIGVMEAIVGADSPLVGRSARQLRLYERYQVNLIAVSRSGRRLKQRLRALKLQAGDAVVLQGNLKFLPETLGELRCLPLAARDIKLGMARRGLLPLAILAVAIGAVTTGFVPVAVGFAGAALAMALVNALSLREAYDVIDWPILVMLACLIPVSEAVRTTGGTDLVAGWLSAVSESLPPMGALTLIMVAAMAVTPFLNNAATVLVMAPIAASFAAKLGFSPDPFLMAVAIGAGCDFLTPIGHQCNTLVMGPGGYRFTDYWRLGLPLSLIVVVVGVPLIALVWPLAAR